ncbi:glycosyltransferase [Paraburkholderia sp. J12]|uniref:glycosyltransferase n=1 Tax=Paraburkholderia sp. J12 TaxID=2805432 RepID=UPI002ABD8A60|nr:glycosyltransferase [Paraburkholderia sp. J12]
METASIPGYRRTAPASPDATALPGEAPATLAEAPATPCAIDATNAASDGWIAIIEPNFTGHRWRYVEWIAQACVEAGHRCVIVTDTEYAAHPLVQRVTREARPELAIALLDLHTVPRGLLRDLSVYARFHNFYARALAELNRTTNVRLVVAPYADYFFYTLAGLGSPFGKTPWIAIVMGMTFHHAGIGLRTPRRPLIDPVKSMLFRLGMRARGLRTLFTIDPTLPDWFASTKPAHAAPLTYVADPFPETPAADTQLARRRLGLDARTRYLLVYGAISERKGIRELMQALMRKGDAPCLVIAGEQDEETRTFIDAHAPHLSPAPVIFDRFVPEDMERDLFSACDAVWLGYRQHYGMSGVLVQAYRFGKPVIAIAGGLIGWFCRDGSLGPLLDDLEPDSIAHAIDTLCERWRSGAAPLSLPSDHLLARNTLLQFKRTLQATLD